MILSHKLYQRERTPQRNILLGWIAAAMIAAVALLAPASAIAAIGTSLVTSIADSTDTSSYDFPSSTYSNNVLYIAFTSVACASGQDCGLGVDVVAAVESVTGAGLTFTEIGPAGGVVFSTDGRRVQAWRALATSGAGTGVVTATMDQTGTSYSPTISASMGAAMIEVTGTKTTGTNGADAIVQWPTNSASGVTSLTVNMAAFADSNNRPLAFFSHRAQSDSEATTHDTAEGYTELHDVPHGSVMMADMTEWHATAANTTPSASWTSSGSTGGFALEIAADSGSNTLEIWVSQGDDDAEESLASGSVDTTSSDLEIIREGSTNNQEVGLRFQNITIPQGATITNAYV
ncbi:MAG: hypothetical protein PVF60_13965, partial [Desulfobacterales bacterium]